MTKKPNIILITIDCLRADYCGWLNPEKKELTPFLNKLAKESFVFTKAYSTGPSTPFAVPGILTGTYPLSFKGWDKKSFPALDQRPYLPEILQKRGYFTTAVHDFPYLSAFFGYDRGFDIFKDLHMFNQGFSKKRGGISFFVGCIRRLMQGPQSSFIKNFLLKKTPNLYSIYDFLKTVFYQNMVIGEIEKSSLPFTSAQKINEAVLGETQFLQNPWFLWIHYADLHEPFILPQKILLSNGMSERDLKRANTQFLRLSTKFLLLHRDVGKENLKLIKNLYQLCLKYLDQQIEQLFHRLKKEFKNSIIIITADHGQEFGEHGGIGHIPYQLYEEVLRVPLLIKVPNRGGKVINKIVSCAQIPATILKLARIKIPPEMESSLFGENKVKVYSESLFKNNLSFSYFDLTTKQKIIHSK